MAHHYTKHDDIMNKFAVEHNMKFADMRKIINDYIDVILEQLSIEDRVVIPRLGTIFQDKYGYHFHAANHLLRKKE